MQTETETQTADDILRDGNGNTASIEYFGSRDNAQAALDSLINCRNCSDCSRCSGCSDCSRCSDCSDCSRCSRCSDCSRCSGCSGCSDCSDCSRCSRLRGDFAPPLVPTIENIHTRVAEVALQIGALEMARWHTCGTTHCRAGWVVHLAGEAGYALERFYGSALAAQLIYRESLPSMPVSPVRFFETNEQATADIKRCAEAEAAICAA